MTELLCINNITKLCSDFIYFDKHSKKSLLQWDDSQLIWLFNKLDISIYDNHLVQITPTDKTKEWKDNNIRLTRGQMYRKLKEKYPSINNIVTINDIFTDIDHDELQKNGLLKIIPS